MQDYESSVVVPPELLQSALGRIRIAVPDLVLSADEGRDAMLGWRTDSVSISEQLGTCFWEFIALDHTDDMQLMQFARRFGPLISSGRFVFPNEPTSAERGGGQDGPQARESAHGGVIYEPLWAWRMCVRGLAALYDLADPGVPSMEVDSSTRVWSRAPFVVAHWLRNAKPEDLPPESGILESLGMRIEFFSEHKGVDWIVSNTLRTAGVGPAYHSDAQRKSSSYTLVAQTLGSDGPYLTWGLLPVLAASLALAAQSQERPRCSYCKKPAAIIHRGPRAGRPWYGDHVTCRALARAETMIRAEDKRAEKRRWPSQEDAGADRGRHLPVGAEVPQR